MTSPPLRFPARVALHSDEAGAYHASSVDGCADDRYHVRTVVPSAWSRVDVGAAAPKPSRPLVPLALYRSPRVAAELEIDALLLSREVEPADWLDGLLDGRGEEVLARRDRETAGGTVSDVLSRRDGFVSRSLAIKNGSHLFLLQGRAAEADYDAVADAFGLAIGGLQILHPEPWPYAERLRSFTGEGAVQVLFFYPESWSLTRERAPGVLHVTLEGTVGRAPVARIDVVAVGRESEPSARGLLDTYLAGLRRSGIPAGPPAIEPAPPWNGFASVLAARATAPCGATSADVRASVLEVPGAWVLVGASGPSRAASPDLSMIVKRAFTLVAGTLRTAPVPTPPPA